MSNEMETKIHDFIECLQANDNFNEHKMEFNLFKILGVTRKELIHSKVLAYFLNSKENHNLGNKFIKIFFKQVIKEQNLEFDNFRISTEIPYRIDIFLLNKKEKFIVVIENKIDSEVHSSGDFDSQLKRYKTHIDADYKNEDEYTKKFILLTPTGYESKVEGWSSLSYKEIMQVFKSLLDEEMDANVSLFINNYIEILEKEIVQIDDQIKEKCQAIYEANKDAITFLMSHIDTEEELIIKTLIDLYLEMEKNNPTHFVFPPNLRKTKYVSFRTEGLNKYFKGKEAEVYFYVYLPNFRLVLQYSKNCKKEAEAYCGMLSKNGYGEIKLNKEDALIAQLDRDSDYVEELKKYIETILAIEKNQ